MDKKEMQGRLGEVKGVGVGFLKGHALAFTKLSLKDDTGKATVIPKKGSCVEGVVYQVTASQLEKLDKDEGVAAGRYERLSLFVHLKKGSKIIEAQVYVACHHRVAEFNSAKQPIGPSKEYMHYLLKGAREWGLSSTVIEQLEKTPTILTKQERQAKN